MFSSRPPSDLNYDNEKYFTAKFLQDVCRIQNIHTSLTTHHLQTKGRVERYNCTPKAAIHNYYSAMDSERLGPKRRNQPNKTQLKSSSWTVPIHQCQTADCQPPLRIRNIRSRGWTALNRVGKKTFVRMNIGTRSVGRCITTRKSNPWVLLNFLWKSSCSGIKSRRSVDKSW